MSFYHPHFFFPFFYIPAHVEESFGPSFEYFDNFENEEISFECPNPKCSGMFTKGPVVKIVIKNPETGENIDLKKDKKSIVDSIPETTKKAEDCEMCEICIESTNWNIDADEYIPYHVQIEKMTEEFILANPWINE